MKFGMRTPSIKKSIKARTTGKAKRAVKKALIPGYGKKGAGWIKNPKKAAYNKVFLIWWSGCYLILILNQCMKLRLINYTINKTTKGSFYVR